MKDQMWGFEAGHFVNFIIIVLEGFQLKMAGYMAFGLDNIMTELKWNLELSRAHRVDVTG